MNIDGVGRFSVKAIIMFIQIFWKWKLSLHLRLGLCFEGRAACATSVRPSLVILIILFQKVLGGKRSERNGTLSNIRLLSSLRAISTINHQPSPAQPQRLSPLMQFDSRWSPTLLETITQTMQKGNENDPSFKVLGETRWRWYGLGISWICQGKVRSSVLVQSALDECQCSADSIDEVILVGGATRAPPIRTMLQSHLDFGTNYELCFKEIQLFQCLNEIIADDLLLYSM